MFPLLGNSFIETNSDPAENTVSLEIIHKSNVPFQFSMKYDDKREIFKIRSASPISSLRIVDDQRNQKDYTVMGSDLIVIPKADFKGGEYVAEIKFMQSDGIVLSRIIIGDQAI